MKQPVVLGLAAAPAPSLAWPAALCWGAADPRRVEADARRETARSWP